MQFVIYDACGTITNWLHYTFRWLDWKWPLNSCYWWKWSICPYKWAGKHLQLSKLFPRSSCLLSEPSPSYQEISHLHAATVLMTVIMIIAFLSSIAIVRRILIATPVLKVSNLLYVQVWFGNGVWLQKCDALVLPLLEISEHWPWETIFRLLRRSLVKFRHW